MPYADVSVREESVKTMDLHRLSVVEPYNGKQPQEQSGSRAWQTRDPPATEKACRCVGNTFARRG